MIYLKSIKTEVTVYPELANAVAIGINFTEIEVQCLNRFYEYNKKFESEALIRWKCQTVCPKGDKCCMRYETITRTKSVKDTVDECRKERSEVFFDIAIKNRLTNISKECEPEFTDGSDECIKLKRKLKDKEKGTEGPKWIQRVEEEKRCLNRFHGYRIQFEGEDRIRWKCQKDCSKGLKCCMRYETVDRLMALNGTIDECRKDYSQTSVDNSIALQLSDISNECKPEYTFRSDECKDLTNSSVHQSVPLNNTIFSILFTVLISFLNYISIYA